MNRPKKQIEAVPPATDDVETPAPGVELPSIRDEFAMRAMAAIISGIVNRGGTAALSLAGTPESLLTTAYEFADAAMGVREAS